MTGVAGRSALLVGSLVAAGLGWFGGRQLAGDGSASTVLATADLYDCPTPGALSVGQLHSGDEVWLIGVSDARWAVIRHPDDPNRMAWMPLALVSTAASVGDLPELDCTPSAAGPATGTVPTGSTAPTTTLGGSTTSSSTSTSSTSTSTTSSTTSTIPADTTPPTVTLTSDRPYLYVVSTAAPCSEEDAMEVAIVVADPSLPLTIRSIIANWTGPGGPASANLIPVGGNRFRLEVAADGPVSGETPLTLTATAADGVGNVGSGSLVVSLRAPTSFGCAG
ncbi:MAG: hypothetical protein Q7V88_17550 [Actinomycetota bacterium]|nr:hypothetical protein [Actinomycetota bacterium]